MDTNNTLIWTSVDRSYALKLDIFFRRVHTSEKDVVPVQYHSGCCTHIQHSYWLRQLQETEMLMLCAVN